MKAFSRNVLLILCCTGTVSFEALAESERYATGGVIHFRGQVVEGGCKVDPAQKNVNVSCFRRGAYQENKIPLQALARGEAHNLDGTSLSLKWMNTQKTLAVISVQYQ